MTPHPIAKRLSLLLLLLASGCAAGPLGEVPLSELDGVRVEGYASLETGQLDGAPRRYQLLAQVDPWASDDIHHFDVYLIANVAEGASAPADVDFDSASSVSLGTVTGGPTAPIIIQNLKKNSIYKVLLKAYDSSGTPVRIDAGSSLCVTTLPVATNDLIENVPFRLRLVDKEFAGVASTTVTITDGEVVSTTTPEVLRTPTP